MRKPYWILLLATAHCAQVLPVDELAGELTIVEASSVTDETLEEVQVGATLSRGLLGSEEVTVKIFTPDGTLVKEIPGNVSGSALTVAIRKSDLDVSLARVVESTSSLILSFRSFDTELKKMSIPYAYSEKLIEDPDDKDSTLVPLAPLTASLSCSLIGQKDGTFTLDSELEVAAGPAHSHFTLLAATDVDLSSLVLKDYDDYIKVAKDISGDSKYSGNASYILPFTSPDNVEQKTRLTVWALEQSAADGVSHQTVPQLIASCEVEPKALDDILLEEGEIDDLGDADLVELEGEAAQKKIVK